MNANQESELEKLIRERKEEKQKFVRERRRRDEQITIERRRCIPFPEGSFEKLESNLIWEKVLCYLTNPSDTSSACLASPTFAKILEKRHWQILLPKTLKVFQEWKKPPHGRVDKSVFLNLRRVSKSWKKGTDAYIFQEDFLEDSWYNKIKLDDNKRWLQKNADMCTLKYAETVDRAMSVIRNDNQALFARKLYFDGSGSDVREGESLEKFICKVNIFLESYGQSVWFFICEGNPRWPMAQAYEYLWNMISKMPNLKALALLDVTKDRKSVTITDLTNFLTKLHVCPFPTLQNLECLHFGAENETLVAQIVGKCTKLKGITFRPIFQVLSEEVSTALEQVEGLERFRTPADLWHDGSFPNVWPLKVLRVTLNPILAKTSLLWPALNQFHRTLSSLEITNGVIKDDENVTLQLPNLKTFDIYEIDGNGFVGFDDLLPLKSLEKMGIHFPYIYYSPEDVDENAKVQVAGFLRRMEHSNIWKCFPFLAELKFHMENVGYVRQGSTLTQFDNFNKPIRVCEISSLIR